jgi:uncharacterized membrane protein
LRLKNLGWLANELPKLVERNIISKEQQHVIMEYYETEKKNRSNVAFVVFSIFGAILLASGIILILAHNWSDLSRPVRTVLSLMPLVVGQTLGFWVILKRRNSVAWCEGVSAFIFLAIGSSIALISQTYHIKGDLDTFLLTWMILAIPLAYVFASTTTAVLYLAGIFSWAVSVSSGGSTAIAYWILLAAILPMLLIKKTTNGHSKQAAIIGWFISLSLIACVGLIHNGITEGFHIILFISLFLSLYIIGSLINTKHSVWLNPFHCVGLMGLAVIYLFLSYREIWGSLSYRAINIYGQIITVGDWVVGIGLPLIAILLLGFALSRRNWISAVMALGLPLTFLGFGLTDSHLGQGIFSAIFSIYMFAGGIAYMVTGIKSNDSKTVNFGFALVSAVIVLRFFDTDLSFVVRGLVFVILGVGFLATNVFLGRRRAAK